MFGNQIVSTRQCRQQLSDARLVALCLEQVQHHSNGRFGLVLSQSGLRHNRVNQFLHLPTTFTCLLFWSR